MYKYLFEDVYLYLVLIVIDVVCILKNTVSHDGNLKQKTLDATIINKINCTLSLVKYKQVRFYV